MYKNFNKEKRAAAIRLAETKRSEQGKEQCIYDFSLGAEWAYSMILKKACELLANYLQPSCFDAEGEPFMQEFINRSVERFKEAMSDGETAQD